jgi:hypothetical protein
MTPKERASPITVEYLRENIAYEPETGVFLWKKAKQGRTLGKQIGTIVWPGYRVLKIENTVYYAHRVAWLYVHGEWPTRSVDHIDGNRANNAIRNLRLATPAQNVARRKTKRTIAPARGVMPHGAGFVARIHHAGVRHYLGYFPTLEAAVSAYEAKAKEIHGEFRYAEAPESHNVPTLMQVIERRGEEIAADIAREVA